MGQELRLPALEVRQGPNSILYTFAADGKTVPSFATVSRVKRNSDQEISGYQRTEVLSHIQEIRDYVESKGPMIPNAVVIAFDSRVRFEPGLFSAFPCEYSRIGTLIIPLSGASASDKPGFIVDGQQRLAAIRDADVESFPVCVTAFITNDTRRQAEQFILVNSTKPLPKGLIYELLPNTNVVLPELLGRRKFPSFLLSRLNAQAGSPMRGRISTPTNPDGVIKDNSVLRMLENSLRDGLLYNLDLAFEGEAKTEEMVRVLSAFWEAVRDTFQEAWALPPKRSRLVHGAGIVSLGFVMDAIASRYAGTPLTADTFRADLQGLKPICRWTDGYWDFGPGQQRRWNEIQNTHKDVDLLTRHLLGYYKARVWRKDVNDRPEMAQ